MSEELHETPPEAPAHVHVDELAVTLEQLNLSLEELVALLGEKAAREPWRDAGVGHATRLVRAGAQGLSYLEVANDAGAAVAFLHLYDDYNPDGIVLGETNPRLSVMVKANDLRSILLVRPVLFRRGIVVAASSDRAGASAPGASLLVDLVTVPA